MNQVEPSIEIRRVFATVGTQCPFPRLVSAVDRWARQSGCTSVFAQTADEVTDYEGIEAVPFLSPKQYERRFEEADVIVGHAGMGTILAAMQAGKPLLIVPRKSLLGEHRNDHQLGTVRRFQNVRGITTVNEVDELPDAIDELMGSLSETPLEIPPPTTLTSRLQLEINGVRTRGKPKVLAIASGGGHWAQLSRLVSCLKDVDLICASTKLGDESLVPGHVVRRVRDGNRWGKLALMRSAADVFRLVMLDRPDVVITTGAAPGYFALLAGRMLRMRTIWVDSIANTDELSLSGKKAERFADLWLTQWPELASPSGPQYAGSVIPIGDEATTPWPEKETGAA